MSKQKLTPWFGGEINPARPGVYQTRPHTRTTLPLYQSWDSEMWGGWASSIEEAHDNRKYCSRQQSPKWRGLASDAKEAA